MANRNTHRPHNRGSSMTAIALLFVLMATLCAVIINVQGHGYLSDPPQMSSVWRQFKVPDSAKNENDNGLFCGGFDVSRGLLFSDFNNFINFDFDFTIITDAV